MSEITYMIETVEYEAETVIYLVEKHKGLPISAKQICRITV